MLEAGAQVKAARIPETNDSVAANRVLRAGFAMRYRASAEDDAGIGDSREALLCDLESDVKW